MYSYARSAICIVRFWTSHAALLFWLRFALACITLSPLLRHHDIHNILFAPDLQGHVPPDLGDILPQSVVINVYK